jgi:hypothetical protein
MNQLHMFNEGMSYKPLQENKWLYIIFPSEHSKHVPEHNTTSPRTIYLF